MEEGAHRVLPALVYFPNAPHPSLSVRGSLKLSKGYGRGTVALQFLRVPSAGCSAGKEKTNLKLKPSLLWDGLPGEGCTVRGFLAQGTFSL